MIGTQIKVRRLVLGINQPTLADRLSVSVATVSNWEIGKTSPRVCDLVRLAAALETKVACLLVEEMMSEVRQDPQLEEAPGHRRS
jgi:transcriptional regulator with XRE-family HTH domain